MTTAGAVWVDVLPSMRSFAPALKSQTMAASAAAGTSAGKGFGGKFAAAAAGAMAALSIGGALATSVKKAGEFDKTLRMLGVATKQSAEGMKQLRDLALDMGSKTVFSAQDAADAMTALAKGGMTAAQIQAGALNQTLTLATAGGLQLGAAAEYMVQGLTTFGIQAKDSAQVAAALAGGANASTASVESMGLALSQVGPIANAAGLSIQDTTAALAAFDNAGVKGSDAGTSLKTMLNNLIPSTEKQFDLFQRLGLMSLSVEKSMSVLRENGVRPLSSDGAALTRQLQQLAANLSGSEVGSGAANKKFMELTVTSGAMQNAFFDANGTIKDMSAVSGTLEQALGRMTNAERIFTAEQLFGTDAQRAGIILSKLGVESMNEYRKATSDAGAAQRLADEAMRGYAGAMENFRGAVETAQIKLGTALLPTLTTLLNFTTNDLLPAMEKLGGVVADVFNWFQKYEDVLIPLISGFGAYLVVVNAAGIATTILTGATRGLAIVQGILNLVMAANPFVLVAALLIGLGVAIVVAMKRSEAFRDAIGDAWSFIKNAFISGIQFATGKFLGFISFLLNGAAKAFSWVPGIGPKLEQAAKEFDKFRNEVNASLEGIKDKEINITANIDEAAKVYMKAGVSSSQARALARKAYQDPYRRNANNNYNGMATGGAVRGPGTGTSDSIPAMLSNGEHVWTAREVAAAGGHSAIEQLRSMVASGAVGRFATGGRVQIATDYPSRQKLRGFRDAVNAYGNAIAYGASTLANSGAARVARYAAQNAAAAGVGPAYSGAYALPVPRGSYALTAGYPNYSDGRFHGGQDFAAPFGTPVYAPMAGYFNPVSLGNRSFGNYADIRAGAVRFIGAHLESFTRGAGMVRAGEQIGRVGSTGNSSGPHLHAEFRVNGAHQNPRRFLSYDQGGKVPAGISTIVNGTGGPEALLTRRQWADIHQAARNGSGNVQVFVEIDGHEVEGAVTRVVDRRDMAFADGLNYRGN